MSNNINLEISKDIVNPIVEAKLKGAITEALGGKENLVNSLVTRILEQKVNYEGKPSTYQSDSHRTYFDYLVGKQIEDAIREEILNQVQQSSSQIKTALVENIRTKSGANKIAKALLSGLENSFRDSWRSKIEFSLEPISNN